MLQDILLEKGVKDLSADIGETLCSAFAKLCGASHAKTTDQADAVCTAAQSAVQAIERLFDTAGQTGAVAQVQDKVEVAAAPTAEQAAPPTPPQGTSSLPACFS